MRRQGDFRQRDLTGKLSMEAQRHMDQIDFAIDRSPQGRDHLLVSRKAWRKLDKAVRKASDESISLSSHTYRGFELRAVETL